MEKIALGLVAFVLAILFNVGTAWSFSNSDLTDKALTYIGQAKGSCKEFVQDRVVELGGTLGIGYRQAYLDVGSEITDTSKVEKGDIIQINDDTNPDSAPTGLHTAIVVKNNGNSTFDVVDSNWCSASEGVNCNIVHSRKSWNAAASATAAGLNLHFYRLGKAYDKPIYPAFNPQTAPIYQWTSNTLAVVDQDRVAHVITDTNPFLAFLSWYMQGCTISIAEFRLFNVNGVNVTNTTGGNLGYQEAINRAYLQAFGFPSSSLVYIPLRGYYSRSGTETWISETIANLSKMSSTDRAYAQAEIDIAKIALSFQQFPQNNCVNGVPKITLLGANPMKLQKGVVFTDPGFTAMDPEDGNVTSNVIISGDTINTSIPGTYVRKYDVSDVQGSHATQVMRIIQVRESVNEMNTSFITIPNMNNNWKRDLFAVFRYNPQTNLPQLIIMDSQTNSIIKEIGF